MTAYFSSPDTSSPPISPRLLFPVSDGASTCTVQGIAVSTREVLLEMEDADALMQWHDNGGHISTHLLGITAPEPWKVFYQAVLDAGLQRTLHFPPHSTLTAGYVTPWGYLAPDALLTDHLLRARHTRAAQQQGWTVGTDKTGRLWSVSA